MPIGCVLVDKSVVKVDGIYQVFYKTGHFKGQVKYTGNQAMCQKSLLEHTKLRAESFRKEKSSTQNAGNLPPKPVKSANPVLAISSTLPQNKSSYSKNPEKQQPSPTLTNSTFTRSDSELRYSQLEDRFLESERRLKQSVEKVSSLELHNSTLHLKNESYNSSFSMLIIYVFLSIK